MTWKEFKASIDRQLLEAGQTEDIELGAIDVAAPGYGGLEGSEEIDIINAPDGTPRLNIENALLIG